jgi:hypothetical protein
MDPIQQYTQVRLDKGVREEVIKYELIDFFAGRTAYLPDDTIILIDAYGLR